MPEFEYTAVDARGQSLSGAIATSTREQAIRQLSAEGRFVLDIVSRQPSAKPPVSVKNAVAPAAAKASKSTATRVPLRMKSAFLAQLSTALSAGLPLLPALRIIQEQADQPALRSLAEELADRVQAGEALSDAFAERPRVFAPLEISMIRVGETAGVLDSVMVSLSEFGERDLEFRSKLRGAATYPVLVLGLAGLSVVVILTFILPRVLSSVGSSPELLPWPTRMLLNLSDLLRTWGWLAAIMLGFGIWYFRRWTATPAGGIAFDGFMLRLPLIGPAMRRAAVARFARTLGTLTKAGIGIIESMRVMRDTLGNRALASKLDKITAGITQGQSIAEPLRQSGEFPPLLIQVIALGERTGKLDELLLRVADAYEKETAAAIARLMSVLPAFLILGLALVVAFVLAAVLLPIVSMELTPAAG